ncbi:MAG: DUF4340 domain-containing protein, partial [Verrucomicrobia bacterium]|nr:DUF4340 domain-containing protein [Verrucomicrobiota bacterium]
MNTRTTWILLLSALLLGAALYLTGPRTGPPAAPGANRLTPIVAGEVTAVELLRSNAVVRVERSTNGWRMTLPIQYGAQVSAVEAFLDALAAMRPRAFISPDQIEAAGASGTNGLKAFGLHENALTVKLETASGRPPLLLKIGGPTPLGGQFYYQQVGDDGIFATGDSLLGTLPRTADSWRDRTLLDLEGVVFDRVEMRGKPSFVLERDPGPATNAWRFTKPLSARADAERVEALLGALERVRVSGFVADSPLVDLGPLGLQPAETELVIGRGTNDLVRLQFGKSPSNAPDYAFVRRMVTTNLVLVPAEAATLVRLPIANFRDRRLTPPLAAADALDFRHGTNAVRLQRQGTNWILAGAAPLPADAARVAQLLDQLAGLPIVEFPSDVPADLARYGLDRPEREWVVRQGTNELVRLSFGAQDKDAPDKAFVRRADEMPVYSVPFAEVLRLPESPSQLRALQFDATNVVQVTVRHKGRSRVVTRGPEGAWQGTSTEPGILFDEAVNETLFRIGHLDGPRYPVRDARQEAALKFPEVDHRLELELAAGSPVARMTVIFGGRDPLDNLYAIVRCDEEPRGFL